MRTVGVIATFVVGFFVLGGLVIGVTLIPDLRRYLRMRSM